MASAYRHRDKWIAKWKDADGRWRYKATLARTNESAVKKHLLGSELARLVLAALRPSHVECFLQAKSAKLGPQSVNHLRGYLSRAFMRAKEAGRWEGRNPIADVRRRKVPTVAFDSLRREEVGPVLAQLAGRWRPRPSRSNRSR